MKAPALAPMPALELSEGVQSVVSLFDHGLAADGGLSRPRWIAIGLTLVTAAAFAWIALAPIDRVVKSEGKIIPAGKNRIVQHLEGGVVAAIHAVEGQPVQAGQTLVDISAIEADSQVKERSVKLGAVSAKIARLEAEAQGRAMPEEAPPGVDTGAWSLERLSLLSRRSKLEQTISNHRQQIQQRQAEILEMQAKGRNLRDELATARRQLDTHESLLRNRAASDLDVLEAKSRVQRLLTQLTEVDQRVPQLEAAIRETQGRIQSESASFLAEVRLELSTLSTEARTIEEEIRSRGERLKRTAIASPVDGVVNRLFVTSVGGVVRAGDPVMEITPRSEQVMLETRVSPKERAELRPGQKAIVKMGPYDYTRYGAIHATLDDVSADVIADERGNTFYRLLLRVDGKDVTAFGQALVPGMPLTADVVLGQRTVGSYVLSSVLRFGSSAMRDSS